ncbi:MAG: pitrilysin family protein [Chloroherpetonaceae bacterium]|nr:insulinase family protein [Chthonomonadaceae bacterium]MDW8208913.1 pitrilysin family protein [Chloroherpetonaceae bacterium]
MRVRQLCRLICCGMIVLAVPGAGQTIRLPAVRRERLPNGIQVVLMPYRRAPLLTVIAQFPGGKQAVPPGKEGVEQVTAEVLRKGTGQRNALQIAEEIEFLGGALDTGADADRLTVVLRVLAKDADAGLDLMADIVRNPTFPQEEVVRARDLSMAGLQALSESTDALADYVLPGLLYGNHPYGRSASVKSLSRLTREDVLDYYARVCAPDRMTLVAVGDFEPEAMLERVRARFGSWEKSASPRMDAGAPVAGPPSVLIVDRPDATQTQVRLARLALPRKHPDFFPSLVAATLLGGGFTSRLTGEVRVRRSLTYGIDAFFERYQCGGSLIIATFTRVPTTGEILRVVREVLRRTASKGFSPAELNRAKNYLSGQFAIRLQSPQTLARELASMTFFELPQDYLRTYLQRIRAVTLADVNRVAQRYFAPEAFSIVLVGPASAIQAQWPDKKRVAVRPAGQIGRE